MAIAVAEEGGIGIIDRGFRSGDIEPQVREVQIVKRTQHGIIRDPYTIDAEAPRSATPAEMDARHGCRNARGHRRPTARARAAHDARSAVCGGPRHGRIAHDAARKLVVRDGEPSTAVAER